MKKYVHRFILSGFLIAVCPLFSENVDLSEDLSPPLSISQEENTLFDEEVLQLEAEFNDLKIELASLEQDMQKNETELSLPPIPSQPEEPLLSTTAPIAEYQAEQSLELEIAEEPKAIQIGNDSSPLSTQIEPVTPDVKQGFKFSVDDMPIAFEMAAKEESKEAFSRQLEQEPTAILNIQSPSVLGEPGQKNENISLNLSQAFAASPLIYTVLFGMSIFAFCIWLYAILSLKVSSSIPRALVNQIHNNLISNRFDDALSLCKKPSNLFCKMVACGIQSRRYGLPVMMESMKAEGKRVSIKYWQKIGLLNDIAIIAPMLGLLGTVMGMFYAFYDVNRSIESISTLFDGLGISVGTTVAGLLVAILALILHSTAKYRLVRALVVVENESQNIATLIDDRTSVSRG